MHGHLNDNNNFSCRFRLSEKRTLTLDITLVVYYNIPNLFIIVITLMEHTEFFFGVDKYSKFANYSR